MLRNRFERKRSPFRRRIPVVWMMVLATSLSSGVSARENSPPDSDRFLRLSRTIFRGRVVNSETFFNSETGDIMTRYLFQVDETLKGPASGQIEIIEYGGTIGGLTMMVPHGARYQSNTEYLVFAWRDGLRQERTLGGDQGALPLIPDQTGNIAVRLGPNHPLNSLLSDGRRHLVDFRSLSRAIAEAAETSSRK